jgi:adenine phosphoribosyltransferase
MSSATDLKAHIRSIKDFPKPGIMFRDITPLLASPAAGVTAVAAAEARGFIFAAPLALELNAAFIPVRKPGKLPFDRRAFQYDLEYGSDSLEMHIDAVKAGDRVLLVDDLLATGGTMQACAKLAEQAGAHVVGCAFVIELTFLPGRKKLEGYDVFSLIQYHDEN